MKNVWVFTSEYEPHIQGGLGTVAMNLAQQLSRLGMKVTVITRSPSQKVSILKKANIRIVRFPAHYTTGKIISYLNQKKISLPAINHIHSLEYSELVREYKRKRNIPYVYTLHSLATRRKGKVYRQKVQYQLLRSAKKIVVPSRWEYSQVVKKYPFCARKTTVIGHGVKLRSGLHYASPYRLLYAGRLTRNKGIEQLLDAMKILFRKYPNARLYIIGKGNAKYVRSLKRRAKINRIHNRIHWLGFYRHHKLQTAYKRFGAVIVPSRRESFGLVALESLANGVPLVSTRAGGLKQFVNSKVAQVIPKVEGKAIARAIMTMIQSPRLTRKRVLAGKKVAATYKWSTAAIRYKRLLTR